MNSSILPFLISSTIVLFAMTTLAKPNKSQVKPTLGEVACRGDTDCILVSHPCEGKEAVNVDFKDLAESRILESSKKRSCPYVPYFIYKQKMNAVYKALCVNRVCRAEMLSK